MAQDTKVQPLVDPSLVALVAALQVPLVGPLLEVLLVLHLGDLEDHHQVLEEVPQEDLEEVPQQDLEEVPQEDLEEVPQEDLVEVPQEVLEGHHQVLLELLLGDPPQALGLHAQQCQRISAQQ